MRLSEMEIASHPLSDCELSSILRKWAKYKISSQKGNMKAVKRMERYMH